MTVAELTEEIDRRTRVKARLTRLEDIVVQDQIIASLQTKRTALIQKEAGR